MGLHVFVKSFSRVPEEPCGDAFWYSEEDDCIWLAVIDGLGSGDLAAVASRAAVDVLRDGILQPHGDAVGQMERLLFQCDHKLRQTRGAALGLARLSKAGGAWYAGVGNIELRCVGSDVRHPIGVNGIVGAGLRKVRVEPFSYRIGDLVLMHSDGLSSHFSLEPDMVRDNLETLGETLVREHRKPEDDMTLLMVRERA